MISKSLSVSILIYSLKSEQSGSDLLENDHQSQIKQIANSNPEETDSKIEKRERSTYEMNRRFDMLNEDGRTLILLGIVSVIQPDLQKLRRTTASNSGIHRRSHILRSMILVYIESVHCFFLSFFVLKNLFVNKEIRKMENIKDSMIRETLMKRFEIRIVFFFKLQSVWCNVQRISVSFSYSLENFIFKFVI